MSGVGGVRLDPRINRRQALGWGGALLGGAALLGGPGAAGAARRSHGGDEVFDLPHPLLPDVSAAGYRGGERPPRPRVVARVTDFGARGDGATDDAEAFNRAVRAVGERGGGALYVPAGTYTLSTPLWMHWSGVVLRGAGAQRTVLHFPRPLEEDYRPSRQSNGNSRWSWTGGQVFFISAELRARSEAENWDQRSEGWLMGDELAVVASATRGQRTLLVSDTAGLEPGAMVVLEVENPPDASLLRELAGEVPGTWTYDWPERAPQLVTGSGGQYPAYASLRWPVRVEAVLSDRLVRIAQPLKHDLRAGWRATLRDIGPTVRDSGVEDLTVRNAVIPQAAHNKHPGSNGVCFQAVHDCWARDVVVENCDVGFGMTSAKSATLTGVVVRGRAAHHSFACRVQSCDNLIEGFRIEPFSIPVPAGAVHHGLNLEGLSAGNVYRSAVLEEGTFDTHRALPFENVRTDITVNNNGRVGGSNASGPLFGARFAHWNVRITNGSPYAIVIADVAPRSATVGVRGVSSSDSGLDADFDGDLESALAERAPVRDLYLAQRSH
jgi:Pectate lyase superfamily protein